MKLQSVGEESMEIEQTNYVVDGRNDACKDNRNNIDFVDPPSDQSCTGRNVSFCSI